MLARPHELDICQVCKLPQHQHLYQTNPSGNSSVLVQLKVALFHTKKFKYLALNDFFFFIIFATQVTFLVLTVPNTSNFIDLIYLNYHTAKIHSFP